MQKRGKAQASVEYLMVVGLAFVIIVPMVYIFYSYSTSMGEEVTEAKVSRIANSMVDSAEEVFYLGEPSKTTVTFDMPQGVFGVSISPDKRELIFKVGDIYKYKEVVAYSNVDIDSLMIPQDLAPGKHSIKAEARGDVVALYSGNYDEAKRLSAAYGFAKSIMDRARYVLDQKWINLTGGIEEKKENDVAYAYGSLDPSQMAFIADVKIDKLVGDFNFWVGGSDIARPGITSAKAVNPTTGITITDTGQAILYYRNTQGNKLYYYNGEWQGTALPALTEENFQNSDVTATIIKQTGGAGGDVYEIVLKKASVPLITATIPASEVLAPKNWLLGDVSSADSYAEGRIIGTTPETYSTYSEGVEREFELSIPYEGTGTEADPYLFFIQDMSISGKAISFDVLMPDETEKAVSFDSYVSIGQGTIPPTLVTDDPPNNKHTYKFEKQGPAIGVGDTSS